MSEGSRRTRTYYFMDIKGIELSRIRAAERSKQRKIREKHLDRSWMSAHRCVGSWEAF